MQVGKTRFAMKRLVALFQGYVMRKCCVESDGKRSKSQVTHRPSLCSDVLAPFLRRGWKAYYASLRDMILYLHKNDEQPPSISIGDTNAIRLHHALAQEAVDYRKRQHVFRLKTSDWAEYLFQTSDRELMNKWIDAINLIAASFSSPPLPAAIDSVSLRFQRPLLPSVQTRYSVVRETLDEWNSLVYFFISSLNNTISSTMKSMN